jgi:L-asparaginase
MRLRILVTGGTFDKEYNELTGRLFFQQTHVPEMLSRGRCRLDVEVETIMMIDSLEMTAVDRARIVERCRASAERAIVITHGTDTIVETADVLAAADVPRKTIVLTGAMVPYAFGSSDGLFNLGSALSFAQILPPGVYIAMNGMHFRWDECRKDHETGYFERTRTVTDTERTGNDEPPGVSPSDARRRDGSS